MRDYIKRNLVLCVIGVASAAWACGDGDDDGNGTGGTGGTAGKGGSAGTGGKGGTGGTSGKGGTGGTSGKGGTGGTGGTTGGTAGVGGDAGGDAGASGETMGGAGQGGGAGVGEGGAGAGSGPIGGAGGAAAGEGGADAGGVGGVDTGGAGAGGAPAALTIAEACAAACTSQGTVASTATCRDPSCETACTSYTGDGDPALVAQYLTMMSCIAENLSEASEFQCADSNNGTPQNLWSVTIDAGGACDDEVCAWTCAEIFVSDFTLYYGDGDGDCGCEL